MHTLCIMLLIHIIMAEQQCCSCRPAQLCSRLLTGCNHAVHFYVVLISIEKLTVAKNYVLSQMNYSKCAINNHVVEAGC